jgi:hypothetical protein
MQFLHLPDAFLGKIPLAEDQVKNRSREGNNQDNKQPGDFISGVHRSVQNRDGKNHSQGVEKDREIDSPLPQLPGDVKEEKELEKQKEADDEAPAHY